MKTTRTPTRSVTNLTRENQPSYMESVSRRISKQKSRIISNINNNRPEKMKATTKSIVLQITLCLTGLFAALAHTFARDIAGVFYPICCLWITTATITAYYEVHFIAFKLTILSFRGIVISIAIFITFLCDIFRHLLTPDNELFFTMIIGNISWIIAVIFMIFLADSMPRVINIFRFLGPFLVISQTLYEAINQYFWHKDIDYTLFTLYNGSLTLNDIEFVSKMQIVWYGCTYIWAVPRDWNNNYFVFVDDRILSKLYLPYRGVSTEITTVFNDKFRIKTTYLFYIITVIGTVHAILYVFVLSYNPENTPNIGVIIVICICIIFGIILFTIIIILIYNYFEIHMIRELILQFRGNMLIVTFIIFIYVAIQKCIFEDNITAIFAIPLILNMSTFVLTICALWIRDGLNILYPLYFVLYFGILLSSISIWNILLLTFGEESNKYPQWFILLEKQAYSQVIILWYLSIYYLLRDRNSHYFVLIRKRRETNVLWGDDKNKYQSVTEYDIDGSSYFGTVPRSRNITLVSQVSKVDTVNSDIIDDDIL